MESLCKILGQTLLWSVHTHVHGWDTSCQGTERSVKRQVEFPVLDSFDQFGQFLLYGVIGILVLHCTSCTFWTAKNKQMQKIIALNRLTQMHVHVLSQSTPSCFLISCKMCIP